MIIVNYVVAVLLLVLGLYAVCTQKNLIKVVLGLGIIDYGINLLIVSVGFNDGGTAPIYTMSDLLNGVASSFFVDPVPQALTLTSIVIGACVDAMALALVIMIYRKYKTINSDEVRRIRG
ncbi:MAG: NADH-quinone oxidoreductase subunit K [Oscillospiraceae bacterium]|nr:cation:proton antiporter [Oscillospiraceae bacterium]MBQ6698465.1 NADH-quinone oxidoreductase subunit K [Oscillospiraceae bacterium]MBQ7054061.1 NADH-quinone oxidoreductase subunit K [Oscillospiraceae bacterium]MBR2180699.1 NADH-quinone oxidoreductase subunit K [Oscillospiraceae bacterium]